MPAKRKSNGRRRGGRNIAGLATRPRMMSRTLQTKRYHGVDTRVFYFKQFGVIDSLLANATPQFRQFLTNGLMDTNNPPSTANVRGLYDMYKILGMKMRFFVANRGLASMNQTAIVTRNQFVRGNHCLWVDQRHDPLQLTPTTIEEVISTASARLINPNRDYTISLWRPKGQFKWGSLRDILVNPDPWVGTINYLITDCTVTVPGQASQIFYYYTIEYKVLVRGRTDD